MGWLTALQVSSPYRRHQHLYQQRLWPVLISWLRKPGWSPQLGLSTASTTQYLESALVDWPEGGQGKFPLSISTGLVPHDSGRRTRSASTTNEPYAWFAARNKFKERIEWLIVYEYSFISHILLQKAPSYHWLDLSFLRLIRGCRSGCCGVRELFHEWVLWSSNKIGMISQQIWPIKTWCHL